MRAALGLALAGIALAGSAVAEGRMSRTIGKALFERAWVPAPSSTRANDGLGPLFNARACISCHAGLERMPVATDASGKIVSDNLVLRFSDGAGRPDPVYGSQLQTAGVPGVAPEGRLAFDETGPIPLALAHGAPASGTRYGARLAPALRGLGRLEDVPDAVLTALADPADENGDGISGRVGLVRAPDGTQRVGRFGWKASAASLAGMVEAAFSTDLGLSTPGRPAPWGDCGERQPECRAAPHGGSWNEPEITGELVAMIRDYLAAVPPSARAAPADHARSESTFARIGCAACHVPALSSPRGTVEAYTDLLLHDMGEELDGGATEPGVEAREWRTAPLWGLSRILASGAGLLHDGRATTLDGAIRAHGGEGGHARARYLALDHDERERLFAFLSSL
ncbi:di-heme oxidoredictase family protein [Microvirga lenta]|uniref:di-heme oxidoredictase family protein n=1 Tax=Microvirga lenta TaxID=2881337 RepID=UPI001CFE5355|nr:di-heme oxidoredictase family protein [Microvirga lenta]MCB5173600.1 thiol oxidoreductase [Microvirga lenta]